MKFKTLDDYYAWTCEWCDTENRTLWVKVANGELTCGACHRPCHIPLSRTGIMESTRHQMMSGLC